MHQDTAIRASFAALIYLNGRRITSQIELYPQPDGYSADKLAAQRSIFCEAALADKLPRSCSQTEPYACELRMRLFSAICESECTTAPEGWSVIPACEDDVSIIRGIYAFAAQADTCFVRGARADWDALLNCWGANDMRAYLFKYDGRARAYAVLGDFAPESMQAHGIYEFFALPDTELSPRQAIAVARSSGLVAPRVGAHVSILSPI